MEYHNATQSIQEVAKNICQGITNQLDQNRIILYLVAYCFVFLFGVTGNFAVIYVVCTIHRMQTTTNVLIANLASADLLVIVFCLPFQLYNNFYLGKFVSHLISCKWIRKNTSSSLNLFVLFRIFYK